MQYVYPAVITPIMFAEDTEQEIPEPTPFEKINFTAPQVVSLICADTDLWRQKFC